MRARLKRFRGELIRRVRYRITKGGVLFTLAVIFVGVAAVVSANNLLFLILATMISTILISGLISRLCLAGLELDLLIPEHVTAGRAVPAKLYVRNLKFWMPSFSIRLVGIEDKHPLTSSIYFPVIPGGSLLEETVEVRFPRRGAYKENSFAFSTRFPFGFLEKTARVTLRREVIVYPSIEPHEGFEDLLHGIAGDIETHHQGLGKDFYRIRPYNAFESSRHVDWKATAHTGDLQVREFAREAERSVEVFLDRDAPAELAEWFERAVDCCAFLCWRLSQHSTGIHFRSQDFTFRLPEEGDIYTILKYLALVECQSGKAAEPPIDETSYQIVFSAAPNRFAQAGWSGACLLGPGDLVLAARGPTEGAGETRAGETGAG
jgi:uncharacterized protein (DUF58 family)